MAIGTPFGSFSMPAPWHEAPQSFPAPGPTGPKGIPYNEPALPPPATMPAGPAGGGGGDKQSPWAAFFDALRAFPAGSLPHNPLSLSNFIAQLSGSGSIPNPFAQPGGFGGTGANAPVGLLRMFLGGGGFGGVPGAVGAPGGGGGGGPEGAPGSAGVGLGFGSGF